MTSDDARKRLIELLCQLSIRTGRFELSSGGVSDLYVDVRQTSLHAEGAALIARLVLERLRDDVVGVGGPTLGADPVACSAAAHSIGVLGRPVHGFLIRKEPKGHGAGRVVEGMENLPTGSKVCVVEDTTTTGGSMLRAIERARTAGLDVVQVLVVVEREEGAVERFAEAGLQLESIVGRAELLEHLA
ncbi:MAG: orotate phosphoribosyltransferase [Myxococcales bacterium]|nr:orotate phosphoribosyltransferase [Myxococcales bacterium]